MSGFNSGHSTVGAGKSGAGKSGFGVDSPWFFPLLAALLLVLSPVAAIVFVVVTVGSRVRRVRTNRVVAAAFVLTLGAGIIVGGSPTRALAWHRDGTISILTPTRLIDLIQGVIDFLGTQMGTGSVQLPTDKYGVFEGLLHTAPVAVPLGVWLAAFATFWMTWRRSALADVEGPRFNWARPEGWLDRARGARNRRKMANGQSLNPKKGTVAVGVGAYGKTVPLNIGSMQQPTIVLGSPRHGKTQLAINTVTQAIALQQSMPGRQRSGWMLIDFKGDGELPAHAAAFAAAHDRRFRHFTLADKSGTPYHPPHPAAPNQPAFYDPLRRGNATSKTDMLVNSVGRDGDAAAYFRAAYELTQIVYPVAALSGYDKDKGGFQVLADLLDVDNLQKVADSTGPDGRGVLADHPNLLARVEKMVTNWKRDDIGRGANMDLARLLSTYGNGPAAGPWLRPGPDSEADIDLYRAVYDGDIVVFSLSVQDYGELAKNIGTLAVLDLQNVIAQLRADLGAHRRDAGDATAAPPWAPFYFQIEEFGSAGADAVLDVLNKAGDVQIRPILSTQSWHDIVAVDDSGTFGRRVLDQASNVFSFGINDGEAGRVLSDLTSEVTKQYPRDSKEFSGGIFGLGLRAANVGSMQTNPVWERQVPPSAFQGLPRYHCIWISKTANQATHTHPAGANRWWEVIRTEPVRPDIAPTPSAPAVAVDAPEPDEKPTESPTQMTPEISEPETADEAPLPSASDRTSEPPAPTTSALPPPVAGLPIGTRPTLGFVQPRLRDEPPLPEPDLDDDQDDDQDPDAAATTPRRATPAPTNPPPGESTDFLAGFEEI